MKGHTIKSFQKVLESGNLIPSSREITDERRICYLPPEELQQEIEALEFEAKKILYRFYILCNRLQLPVNNPIAFFHAVDSRKSEFLSDEKLLADLRLLLKLVYADRCFLFGSSYDYFGPGLDLTRDLRLSDLTVLTHSSIKTGAPFTIFVDDLDKEVYDKKDSIFYILLNKQSRLKCSLLFVENYKSAEMDFDKLEYNNQKYFKWKEQYTNQKDHIVFHITPKLAKHFYSIYSYFSRMDVSERKMASVKKELNIIKNVGEAVLAFSRFIHIANRIVDRKEHCCSAGYFSKLLIRFFAEKRILIETFLNFDSKTKSDLQEQISDYQKALSLEPHEKARYYPLFACGRNIGHLSDNEKCFLETLKRHAFIRCLTTIENELSCTNVQKISAFYLFQIFNYTDEIRSPFLTRNWVVDPRFKCDITVASSDSTAVTLQKKSICLFNLLIEFCAIIFPRTFDIELCEHLFERCRAYTPINRFYAGVIDPDNIRTIISPHQKQSPLQSKIDTQVTNNLELDEMSFQQYASIQATRASFYNFRTDKKMRKRIWNVLEEILTPDVVERYCKIVYYPEDGFGTSCQSREWHVRLADLLDEIIDSNATICDYVDGVDLNADEIMLPDSDISVAAYRESYTAADDSKPEKISFILNHAFVQLAIHRICMERIAAKTRKIALSLFKEIFYDR